MAEDTHTDFEIAIERELHGALPESEAAQLAEHLLGCATCRAYQRTAMEMETSMEAMGNLFSKGVVWARVHGAVEGRVSDERARFWITVAGLVSGLVALGVGLTLSGHSLSAEHRGMLTSCTVGVGAALLVAWRRIDRLKKRAADSERSIEDLFRTLDDANRSHTRQAFVGLASSCVLAAVIFPHMIAERSPMLWGMAALFTWTVVDLAQRLVRLRRERAAMLRG